MIKRLKCGKILVQCNSCKKEINFTISGIDLVKMNKKLPEGWTLKKDKIFCPSCEKINEKKENNSQFISKENWTGTV